MKSLGIYIHISYCANKCRYCDFNSFATVDNSKKILDKYVKAVSKEIELFAKKTDLSQLTVESIFFGGGTPTVLEAGQICRILEKIKLYFNLSTGCEISIEANPDTVTYDKLLRLKEAGFNRISLGAQSFNDKLLENIGRAHNSDSIHKSVFLIHKAGFINFSIDLMFGLPGQTITEWEQTIKTAINYRPIHISSYNLTVEKNTALYDDILTGRLALPDEDTQTDMYKMCIDMLTNRGYQQYEISSFSLPDFQCMHNLRYWSHEEYLGFGAGAVSYIDNRRKKNMTIPEDYMFRLENELDTIEREEILSRDQSMSEMIMLGLRTMKGMSIKDFNSRFYTDFLKLYENILADLLGNRLITIKSDFLTLTPTGLLFHNDVACVFF